MRTSHFPYYDQQPDHESRIHPNRVTYAQDSQARNPNAHGFSESSARGRIMAYSTSNVHYLETPNVDNQQGNQPAPNPPPQTNVDINASATLSLLSYAGANGLQVYQTDDDLNVVPNWIRQLQISTDHTHTSSNLDKEYIEQRSNSRIDAIEAVRRGWSSEPLQNTNGVDASMGGGRKHISMPPLLTPSQPWPPNRLHSPKQNVATDVLWLPTQQSLNRSSYILNQSSREQKPAVHGAQSDMYTSGHSTYSRPSIAPNSTAAVYHGRSLSAGHSAVKRGSRGWLAFHASRLDLGDINGWDEG